MAKKRVHYIKVRVVFDKPVGQQKAVAEVRKVLPPDGYYTAPDAADGASEFKLSGIAAAKQGGGAQSADAGTSQGKQAER